MTKVKNKIISMRINESDLVEIKSINQSPSSLIQKFVDLAELIGYKNALNLIELETLKQKTKLIEKEVA